MMAVARRLCSSMASPCKRCWAGGCLASCTKVRGKGTEWNFECSREHFNISKAFTPFGKSEPKVNTSCAGEYQGGTVAVKIAEVTVPKVHAKTHLTEVKVASSLIHPNVVGIPSLLGWHFH